MSWRFVFKDPKGLGWGCHFILRICMYIHDNKVWLSRIYNHMLTRLMHAIQNEMSITCLKIGTLGLGRKPQSN